MGEKGVIPANGQASQLDWNDDSPTWRRWRPTIIRGPPNWRTREPSPRMPSPARLGANERHTIEDDIPNDSRCRALLLLARERDAIAAYSFADVRRLLLQRPDRRGADGGRSRIRTRGT